MDFETTVLYYLARKGLFLSPQYPILADGSEWSCPDFVGLDFVKKEVSVVEVTTAYQVGELLQKVNDRENYWFQRLREQLRRDKVVDNSWQYMVRVFLRQERIDYFKRNLAEANGVVLQALEEIAFPWAWDIDNKT
jgi:hypothetical protein